MSAVDMIGIVVVFFFLCVSSVAGLYMYSTIQDTSVFSSGIMETMENSFLLMGAGAMIFFFGAGIVAAAYASMVRNIPALAVAGMFFLIPIFILGVGLSAGWTSIASGSLSTQAARLPLLNTVMSNLPQMVLVMTFIILIATFGGYYVSQ